MPNTIDLANRFAVVTGGAQEIGRAITERLLNSGAAVAIWDRDKAFAEKTARELANRGQTLAVACDVTKLADVERARDDTAKNSAASTSGEQRGHRGQEGHWDYPATNGRK